MNVWSMEEWEIVLMEQLVITVMAHLHVAVMLAGTGHFARKVCD